VKLRGMEINPYKSPATVDCVRKPRKPLPPPSAGALIAAAVIIPLAILNLIHVAVVLFTQ